MKKILFLTAALLSNTALAFTPESGWWWNPERSGSGFNIEVQNGTLFVATFVYDEAGNPTWYSGAGKLDANNAVTVPMTVSMDGSCVSCGYQAPVTSDAGIPMTINFTSGANGVVTWQGQSIPISRFNFGLGGELESLIGEWVFMEKGVSFGDYEGDRITFSEVSEGLAHGNRTGLPTEFALANYSASSTGNVYIALVYRSTSLMTAYLFRFSGLNRVEGLRELVWTTDTTEEMLQDLLDYGDPFEGYRVR